MKIEAEGCLFVTIACHLLWLVREGSIKKGTHMTTAEIKAWATEYIMNTYGDRQLAFVKGEGAYVWSADGKKYLDFLS